MPPELLPEVPDLEVLGQLFEKRSQLEVKLRRAIAMVLGFRHGFQPSQMADAMLKGLPPKRDRPQPKEMFVGRAPQDVLNELYTLDLKNIVLANWEEFQALFDNKKVWFEMHMDVVNKARRVDAHTKPVTPGEAAEFNGSYQWLLNRLSKVPA